MRAIDLKNEFKNKEKSIEDIANYIKIQSGNVPNYTLLLGAGCSVSSGIKTGKDLVRQWREGIFKGLRPIDEKIKGEYDRILKKYEKCEVNDVVSHQGYEDEVRDFLKRYEDSWYNASKEYSCLFERKFDLPRQRRAFVEEETRGKNPQIGYAYLIDIIERNFVNTIFTTNFDDLINEAFYQFSSEQRPIVCAHDSAINSITVTSPRPKIIKLHGDYLFDDIKTTISETESLEDNMKQKFMEFAKDYGLIVIGYSGTDRSIMDIMNVILKNENYYKNGIYWVLRENTVINDELKKLLRHERVFYVFSDGFDECMADLHANLLGAETLPIQTSAFNNRPKIILKRFLDNEYNQKTNNSKIKSNLENLEVTLKKNNLYDLLKEGNLVESKSFGDEEFSVLLEANNYIKNKKIDKAISLLNSILETAKNKRFQIECYLLLYRCYRLSKDKEQAKMLISKIYELDDKNPKHLLLFLDYATNLNEKLDIVNNAIEKNPYSASLYERKADYLIDILDNEYKGDREDAKLEIIECLNKSIELDPSFENNSWATLLDFYLENFKIENIKNQYKELIQVREKQQGKHPKIIIKNFNFDMKDIQQKYGNSNKQAHYDKLENNYLKIISQEQDKVPYRRNGYEKLKIEILLKSNNFGRAELALKDVKANTDNMPNFYIKNYAFLESQLLRRKYADVSGAADILIARQEKLDNKEYESRVLDYLLKANRVTEAENRIKELINERNNGVIDDDSLGLIINCLIEKREFDEALLKANDIKSEKFRIVNQSFILLKQNKYQECHELTHNFLQKINYLPNDQAISSNYYFSKKMLGHDLDKEKFQEFTKYHAHDGDYLVHAVFMCLEDNYEGATDFLEYALFEDKSRSREIFHWPIFNEYRRTESFLKIKQKHAEFIKHFLYLDA